MKVLLGARCIGIHRRADGDVRLGLDNVLAPGDAVVDRVSQKRVGMEQTLERLAAAAESTRRWQV